MLSHAVRSPPANMRTSQYRTDTLGAQPHALYLRLAPTLVCGSSELSVRPVENSNSGYSWPRERRRRCSPPRHRPIACMSAAMACPSGRVGEQLERHADKHRFPMRIRPGDRPPVQLSITHNFRPDHGAQPDIGEARQAAPYDNVSRRRIIGSFEIAAQSGDLGQIVAQGFPPQGNSALILDELVEQLEFGLGQGGTW